MTVITIEKKITKNLNTMQSLIKAKRFKEARKLCIKNIKLREKEFNNLIKLNKIGYSQYRSMLIIKNELTNKIKNR